MLTIKDLTASKQLNSKDMAGVTGGYGGPASLNIESAINAPKFAELMGLASSSTGPQFNINAQTDNDYNAVIGSGQVVNSGGNFNTTYQGAFSNAGINGLSAQ